MLLRERSSISIVVASALRPLADRGRAAVLPGAVLFALVGTLAACRKAPTGEVHEVDLVAAPASVTLVDGSPIEVWAYNGQVPGPTLRIRLGDTLRVRFENRLPQATTIHWHGVRVPNDMDGVPWVTQPPVEPGGTFVYELTPPDAGTFWFHPHLRSSEQVERGLFGALVVEDRDPPPFSRDELWVLDDLLLAADGQIAPAFNTRRDLAHDGRWGNTVLVNGRRSPALAVEPGERLRLRLLNVANGRVFAPDLSPLQAKIVAVDGRYTARPIDAAAFEIAPGNRVDLDVVVPPEMAGQRVPVVDRFTRRPFPLAEIAVGGGAPVDTPRFTAPATADLPDGTFRAEEPARADFLLNARPGGPLGIEWTINGAAMVHAEHAENAAPYSLPLGERSRIRFANDSYRLHPMHLHGMFFRVVARNGAAVDEPFTRDTVLVHAKETVDASVVPLDPGLWMAHCHVLEHAEAGMMTLIEVR
jgi:FtsP/CotA-like multicopper oxidase with cupredoxin domain